MTERADDMFSFAEHAGTFYRASGMAENLPIARFIGRVGARIARPPRIVILGDFNSGKSTLANTLLGGAMLPTSVLANTELPILIEYSAVPALSAEMRDGARATIGWNDLKAMRFEDARLLHLGLPVERLRRYEIIDTPGLGLGRPHIEELVHAANQRAHLAIWCTHATQAWKASERTAWLSLPARLRRTGLLAVTHKDALRSNADEERLGRRLAAEAGPEFQDIVRIAGSKAAASSALTNASDETAWRESGGAELVAKVQDTLAIELSRRLGRAEQMLSNAASHFATAMPL